MSIAPLRVTVVGTGYLGLTHATCMADLGHDVLAIDADLKKLAQAAGQAPFFGPGLEPLLRKNLDAKRRRFTDSHAEIGAFGDVHFLCVGTPSSRTVRPTRLSCTRPSTRAISYPQSVRLS
jgi:UDPglucose 6-dehydrogenase